jgi:hypothetical protein
MKKIIVIFFLFLVGCGEKVTGLKDETFNCSGIGGQKRMMNVTFKINPDTKTLTFTQSGELFGNIINYPREIIYSIKSSDGVKILTNDYEYSWRNLVGRDLYYISYISTDDKKVWKYKFKDTRGEEVVFKNCN